MANSVGKKIRFTEEDPSDESMRIIAILVVRAYIAKAEQVKFF